MFLVSGGWAGSGYLDSTEIFDPSLISWRAGAALPSPRSGLKATNIDNRIFLFGNDIFGTPSKKNKGYIVSKRRQMSLFVNIVKTRLQL